MKWVEHVQTRDGKLHRDYLVAKAHAENVYDLALTKMAHQIIHVAEKFSSARDFIDANLQSFVELKALKTDIELEKTENYE